MELRNPRREVIRKLNPVDYWAKFHADWRANPNVISVVRYEKLLEDQSAVVREVKHALGYRDGRRAPVEIQLDLDRHSPVGRNIPSGYQRKTTGNWRRIFSAEDTAYFEERAGDTLRASATSTTRSSRCAPLRRRARRRPSPRRRDRRGAPRPRSARWRGRTSDGRPPSSG